MIPPTNAATRSPLDADELEETAETDEASGAETGEGASDGEFTIRSEGFSAYDEGATNFYGNNEGVSFFGGDGSDTVNFHGKFSGTIDGGGGGDRFVAHAGSEVRDSEIRGGDGRDQFFQQEGATFVDTELHGGDDADMFELSGHNEGTYVDLGHNGEELDRLFLMPTVTGDISAVDPDHSEYDVKDEKLSDHDAVHLMNGDGKTWVENENGDYALRDDASGEIVSDFDAGGNKKSIENIASYDLGSGELVEQFRDVEPELKFSSPWAKWAGDIFTFAGMVVPALLPVGAAFKMYYAADNNMLSLETGLDIGLGAIPGGATATYVKNGVKTIHSFAEGEVGNGLIGLSSFIPGGDFKNVVYGAGQSWNTVDAIGDEDYGRAASTLGNTVSVSGLDTGGHVGNTLSTGSNLFKGWEAFSNDDYLSVGQNVFAAGKSSGVIGEEKIESTLPEGYTPPSEYTSNGATLELDPSGSVTTVNDANGDAGAESSPDGTVEGVGGGEPGAIETTSPANDVFRPENATGGADLEIASDGVVLPIDGAGLEPDIQFTYQQFPAN